MFLQMLPTLLGTTLIIHIFKYIQHIFSKNKIEFVFSSTTFLFLILHASTLCLIHFVNIIDGLGQQTKPSHIASITICVAFTTAVFVQMCSIFYANRKKSFEIISQVSDEDNALKHIRVWQNNKNEIKLLLENSIKNKKSLRPHEENLKEAFVFIANFYEEMSIAIENETVNESFLRKYFLEMFINFYEDSISTIELIRDASRHSQAFCYMERLYGKWSYFYLREKAEIIDIKVISEVWNNFCSIKDKKELHKGNIFTSHKDSTKQVKVVTRNDEFIVLQHNYTTKRLYINTEVENALFVEKINYKIYFVRRFLSLIVKLVLKNWLEILIILICIFPYSDIISAIYLVEDKFDNSIFLDIG